MNGRSPPKHWQVPHESYLPVQEMRTALEDSPGRDRLHDNLQDARDSVPTAFLPASPSYPEDPTLLLQRSLSKASETSTSTASTASPALGPRRTP